MIADIKSLIVPGSLLVAASAWQQLKQHCLAAGKLETGGLVVGRRVVFDGKPFLVAVFAGGPGHAAEHKQDEFAPDTVMLQLELEQVRGEWAAQGVQVDYLGLWHRHPGSHIDLSEGDIKQAHVILSDPSYQLEWGEIILPIATLQKKDHVVEVALNVYYLARLHPTPLALDWAVWEDAVLHDLLLGL